jgi:hypothetical protein
MTFVRPAGPAPHPPWARRFGIPSSPTVEGRSENQKRLAKNMNLTKVTLERRQKLRKMPDELAFLQLERDDGGSVLDVSEGGLRFETFDPVPQSGPVHFWFSLNLRERIEAWGEVVWINAAKKCGGLRFLRLSEEGRAQIREWLARPAPQAAPEEEFVGRGVVTEMPARTGASETDAVARFVSKARPREAASGGHTIPRAWEAPGANPPAFLPSFSTTGEAGVENIPFPRPEEVRASGELVPMQRYLSATRRQLILGLVLGTCISAAVAAAAIKYSNYRHETTGSRKAAAESSAQKSPGGALPPGAVNPSTASSPPIDIFGSSQNKAVAKIRTPGIPAAETGGHSGPRSGDATSPNPSARASLQPSLSANTSRQKSLMTPEQLWASVQAGNTKSAVTLAELYIKGEGVPQNCNQARVLLLVASEKRNAGAIKRLQELDKTDCPAN